MEILSQSIKGVVLDALNDFQMSVWQMIVPLLNRLIPEKISDESYIDDGSLIDVILKVKETDFIIGLSIRKNVFYINSKYFDIYVYPETPMDRIKLLTEDIFLGKYLIKSQYGSRGKLVYRMLIFKEQELKEYNEYKKIAFFTKKVKKLLKESN